MKSAYVRGVPMMTSRQRVILFWSLCWLIVPCIVIKVFVGVGIAVIKTVIEYTLQKRSG